MVMELRKKYGGVGGQCFLRKGSVNDFSFFSLGRTRRRREGARSRKGACRVWLGRGSGGGPDSDRRGINSLGPQLGSCSVGCL